MWKWQGVVSEFGIPKAENPNLDKYQFQWLYANGLLAVIFAFGLLYTALKSRRARSWRYGTIWFRGFVADYGVPLMVLVWTGMSFAVPSKVPKGVPRRLFCPLPWESASLYHWTVIKVFCLLCWWWFYGLLVFLIFAFNQHSGYVESSSHVHICCHYPSHHDCWVILLWPQCGLTIGTTEGVQSEEAICLPLRHLVARANGT